MTPEINYLGFIAFNNSGVPIYEHLLDSKMSDATLLTGLLTALQALTVEITDEKLEELELRQFQIFLLSSTDYPVSYGLIGTGSVVKKHALNLISEIRAKFEGMNSDGIKDAIEYGSIVDNKEFDTVCNELLVKGNRYLRELASVKDEFFGGKDIDKESKSKVKSEFF